MKENKHRYVIYAPSFNENVGGAIALHRLCDRLNKIGIESCIYPRKPQFYRKKLLRTLRGGVKAILTKILGVKFKTFHKFTTPLCSDFNQSEDIVIYPETVIGNPLKAKHVVRWLLYHPGCISGEFNFDENDLFFYYQKAFLKGDNIKNIGGELKVIYLQDVYKNSNKNKREGTCYILRKGKGRELIHDLDNSVLIDGLSHEEIAKVFNSSEMCISYDMHTMYSKYAAVCGCLSIVVPVPEMDKFQWRAEKELRLGVAYGFDDIGWAKATQDQVLPLLKNYENKINEVCLDNFIKKCESHFL